jgi:hypothetical protein
MREIFFFFFLVYIDTFSTRELHCNNMNSGAPFPVVYM